MIEADLAELQTVNTVLKFTGTGNIIEIKQIKYLNNILEQDHRFIKRSTKPMMGFKALHSASATIEGIKVAYMIRKNQFANDNRSPSLLYLNSLRCSQYNCAQR
jgi:putative transposase